MSRKTQGTATVSLISSLLAVAIAAFLLRSAFDISNLYLLCVSALAYRYAWKFAAILTAATLVVLAYRLSPIDGSDGYQLVSYAVCAAVVIWVMARLRPRSQPAL